MASGNEHKGKGKFEQAKGAVKEGFGALTGDRGTEMEGKAERAKGKIREGYGEVKSEVNREPGSDSARRNNKI
ncbi:MAG TPA: CsbD family protein [Thermoanaerobaculia bacterium]